MNYPPGDTVTYSFGIHDFGNAADALAIKPPANYTWGEIIDVGVAVTETFTATTTPAYVRIGTATDADAYVELNMGTAADTDYYNTQDDPDAILQSQVPSDTQLEVAFVQPTGGVPAGAGYVTIIIRWFK